MKNKNNSVSSITNYTNWTEKQKVEYVKNLATKLTMLSKYYDELPTSNLITLREHYDIKEQTIWNFAKDKTEYDRYAQLLFIECCEKGLMW
jgi:hypothetical protein